MELVEDPIPLYLHNKIINRHREYVLIRMIIISRELHSTAVPYQAVLNLVLNSSPETKPTGIAD